MNLNDKLYSTITFFNFPLMLLMRKRLDLITISNEILKHFSYGDLWNCFRAHLDHFLPDYDNMCDICYRNELKKTDRLYSNTWFHSTPIYNKFDIKVNCEYKNQQYSCILACDECRKKIEKIEIVFAIKKKKVETICEKEK
jgi:hypothetical protein